MQWLIDIILEIIGIPPCFINRGDATAPDFAVGDFWADNTWRNLDLSSIIPEHATAVLLAAVVRNNLISKRIRFRTDGNVDVWNVSEIRTQVANIYIPADIVVPLPASRIIEYRADAGGWTTINVTVKGWWL